MAVGVCRRFRDACKRSHSRCVRTVTILNARAGGGARVVAAVLLALLALGCQPAATLTPFPAAGVTQPPGPTRPVERARVVRVVDGDTVIVALAGREERLRYIGIDAPESVRPDSPVEPFGPESAAANAALVGGREVIPERDVSDRDEFGRLLRYVWLETADGTLFVNLDLVVRGYANPITIPPDVLHAGLLRAAARSARDAGRGLWSLRSPASTRSP